MSVAVVLASAVAVIFAAAFASAIFASAAAFASAIFASAAAFASAITPCVASSVAFASGVSV